MSSKNPIQWATAEAKRLQRADKNKHPWKYYTTKAWATYRAKNKPGKKVSGNVVRTRKTNVTYNVPVAVPGKSAFGSLSSHLTASKKILSDEIGRLMAKKLLSKSKVEKRQIQKQISEKKSLYNKIA